MAVKYAIIMVSLLCIIVITGCGGGSGVTVKPDSLGLPDPINTPVPTPTASPLETNGWKWQNPTPSGDAFMATFTLDGVTGWAVGYNGTIMKTTDSGHTWTKQNSGVLIHLKAVYFVDANTGWCAGDKGVILKTTNGGTSWTPQTSGLVVNINGLYFADANTGWAVGNSGKIISTLDGGTTWAEQNSGVLLNLNVVVGANANDVWAAGDDTVIVVTGDGGTTWVDRTVGIPGFDFFTLYMDDATTGYAAGHTVIIWTNTSWAFLSVVINQPTNVYRKLTFPVAANGWVVGDNGLLRGTTDNGNTWPLYNSGTTLSISSLGTTDLNNFWTVGALGTLRYTTDGANSWTQSSPQYELPANITINKTFFQNTTNGFLVTSEGAIYKTEDEGYNWAQVTSPVATSLNDISFLNETTGVIVGNGGYILRSTDSGNTWTSINSPTTNNLNGLSTIPTYPYGFMACGNSGDIIYSLDQGATWLKFENITAQNLKDISTFDGQFGFAVGSNGTVLGSNQGCSNWEFIISGTASNLNCVSCPGYAELWVAGENDTIRHSLNTGNTWSDHPVGYGAGFNITDIYFIDSNNGWITASYEDNIGLVFFTSNGGTTWTNQYEIYGAYPKCIFAVNNEVAWIGGTLGIFLHTADGGVPRLPFENMVNPEQLRQNYDELFNSQKIKGSPAGFNKFEKGKKVVK